MDAAQRRGIVGGRARMQESRWSWELRERERDEARRISHPSQRAPLPSEAEVIAEVTQGGKGARISLLSVEEQFLAEIDLLPCISHPHPTSSSSR